MSLLINLMIIKEEIYAFGMLVPAIVVFKNGQYYVIRFDPKTSEIVEEISVPVDLKTIYLGG